LIRIYAYGSPTLSHWDTEDSRLVYYERDKKLVMQYCDFKFARTMDPNKPPEYHWEDTFDLWMELQKALKPIPL